MRDTENYCYSLYFSDTSIANKIYGTAEENNIYISSDAYNSVKTIIDVVEIFTDFFVILTIGLCLACVLLLVNFSAGNIRRRKYEIGVIKAMGGQTKEVGKIFILQVLFIGLIVCAISTISLLLMSSFVNSVLLNAMLFFVDNPTLGVISIVKFNPLVMFIDVIIMLAITFLSSLIPLIKLHRIKPVNIIKHKN
jgi:ABC-type antimicrobial peptide transport system permease subunit